MEHQVRAVHSSRRNRDADYQVRTGFSYRRIRCAELQVRAVYSSRSRGNNNTEHQVSIPSEGTGIQNISEDFLFLQRDPVYTVNKLLLVAQTGVS